MMHWSIAVNELMNFGENQSYLMVIVKMKQMKWIDYSYLIEVKLAIITLLLFRTKQIKMKRYEIHRRMHSQRIDDDAIENATFNKIIWNWREIQIQNYLIKSFKCRFSLAHKILIGIRLAYERECWVCLAWLCDHCVDVNPTSKRRCCMSMLISTFYLLYYTAQFIPWFKIIFNYISSSISNVFTSICWCHMFYQLFILFLFFYFFY